MSLPDNFRPMLAINIDKVKTQPNVRYCSEKLDGIRMIVSSGIGYSRSLKPLPNKQLQAYCKKYSSELEGFDGEVIAGDLYAVDVLQQSTSFCMSEDKETEDWKFYVFDKYNPELTWITRFLSIVVDNLDQHVVKHEHYFVREKSPMPLTKQEQEYTCLLPWVTLDTFEQSVLVKGGEGVMLRDALGKYKCNRSGTKNLELQKVKRFSDDEFKVISYTQFETNQNELQRDERGYAKRSTSKDGKQLVEALGGLVCITSDGVEFNVGSGFTEAQRKALWEVKETLIGRLAKVQFFGYSKDKVPLLPVFLDFRNTINMD